MPRHRLPAKLRPGSAQMSSEGRASLVKGTEVSAWVFSRVNILSPHPGPTDPARWVGAPEMVMMLPGDSKAYKL